MTNRIRELREQTRLTQGEVAKLLDVDESEVSRWETGRRALSPTVIDKLAAVFKVASWEVFFDRKGLRQQSADSDAIARVTNDETAEGSRGR